MQGIWLSKYRLFLCEEKKEPITLFGTDGQFYKVKGRLPDGSMLLDLKENERPYCRSIPSDIERSNNHIRRRNNLRGEKASQEALVLQNYRNSVNIVQNVSSTIFSNFGGIFGPFGAILGKLIGYAISQINLGYVDEYNKLLWNYKKSPIIEPDLKVIREIPLIKYRI